MRRHATNILAILLCAALVAAAGALHAANPFQLAIRESSPSVVKVSVMARTTMTRTTLAMVASGVFLSDDGFLATSASAIGQARRAVVTLPDGTQVMADVLKTDVKLDLAILKAASPGHAIQVSPTTPFTGQWVVAIGNPFGLSQSRTDALSASVGVVSGVQAVEAADYSYAGPVILSDIIVNPGSSGGALVDLAGKLVGVCGRVITEKKTNSQISFAVPVAQVMALLVEARKAAPLLPTPAPTPTPVPTPTPTPAPAPTPTPAPALKPHDSGYLGAYIIDDALGTRGAYIERIVPGSPAEDAGLQDGDIITAVNGKTVANGAQFLAATDSLGVGARVDLTVLRDKDEIRISVTLSKAPKSVLK